MAEKEETKSDTKLDSLTTLYDWNPINGSYAFFVQGSNSLMANFMRPKKKHVHRNMFKQLNTDRWLNNSHLFLVHPL